MGGNTVTTHYTHDDNGNITSISDGTNTVTYTYDSANQLIREEKAGAYRHSWTYDYAGNILSRTEETWTNGAWGNATTYTYTYGDDLGWGDLLTAYNGQEITYDAIGNPLTDGTRTYTWKHGRQLAILKSNGQTWTFTYDASGMRTQRSRPGRTDKYVYNGSQLMQMKRGTGNTLDFTYDATGRPTAVTLNGTLYYYVTNLQGDITAIVDTTGATVVRYTYDAWGKNLGISGTLASTLGQYNPLRYRGYVYDQETALYYLQSRYYNPEIGRFINADNINFLGVDGGPLSYNLFSYCGNNAVLFDDPSGYIRTYNVNVADTRGATGWHVPNRNSVVISNKRALFDIRDTFGTDEEIMMFISVVAGEAIGGTIQEQKAVANTIMNRVYEPRDNWSRVKCVTDALTKDAYNALGGEQYYKCMAYLKSGCRNDAVYEALIYAVMPIYYGGEADFTGGAHFIFNIGGSQGLLEDLLKQPNRYVMCGPFDGVDPYLYCMYRALY